MEAKADSLYALEGNRPVHATRNQGTPYLTIDLPPPLKRTNKKDKLYQWLNYDLKERFRNRIIDFDLKTATVWGQIQAHSELSGKAMPAIDGQIVATGISYDLTVVTRNTKDMEISGAILHNPWKSTYWLTRAIFRSYSNILSRI